MMSCSSAQVAMMRSLPRTAALLLVATGTAQAFAPAPAFNHQDWEIACDNTGTCRAAGYGPDDGANGFSLLLERKGGPGTEVDGRLRFGGFDDAQAPQGVLRLQVNGKDLGRLADAADDDDDVRVLRREQVTALLKALPGRATIVVRDGNGRTWPISAAGASAVLLRMDDVQGRLGTPGALMRSGIRAGSRPESAVPAARPAPVIARAPALVASRAPDAALANDGGLRAALRATLGADQECTGLQEDHGDVSPLEVQRLDTRHVLVAVSCWRGAYNEGIGFWVASDSPPWQPALVTLDASDFDHGTATVSAVQKGRGLGDCLWSARWRWDGAQFQRAHEQTSGMCRGFAGGAWDMPTWITIEAPEPAP